VFVTLVKDTDDIPRELNLLNTPNPFNPSTTLSFTFPASGKASLVIYDITGRKVRELVSGQVSAGVRTVRWDGRDDSGIPVSSGVYFARLTMGKNAAVGKMLLVK
jgi:flagellar hook assembly protein FlgD